MFGVKLIVLTEGVIVIADGSCAELLPMESPFVSLIPEIVFTAVVFVMGPGFVSVVTLTDVVFVDLVGVTVGLVVVVPAMVTALAALVVVDVVIVALLLNLFAKRLLIRVEVLVVGIDRELDVRVTQLVEAID